MKRWLLLACAFCWMPALGRELRVCADPNNLPFSNREGKGFENRIVELLAHDLDATVRYVWWPQRRGAIRNTLDAESCDIIPGIVSGMERVATTRPYYRSAYVFVVRADGALGDLASLDDPRLAKATVGVQLIGDDGANTPPAHALSRRGLIANVHGYMLYGDYAGGAPQRAIVDAVAAGDIDVAIVWGPTAGYFAKDANKALRIALVTPWLDGPQWPMRFDVSMGVRKADVSLRRELDRALERNAAEIRRILQDYGVPTIEDLPPGESSPAVTATHP
jgi:mxaJ protein